MDLWQPDTATYSHLARLLLDGVAGDEGDRRRHRDRTRAGRTNRTPRRVVRPPGIRLAELREGVWLRPASLLRPRPSHIAELAQGFTARPEQPSRALATSLWALDTWAETADALLTHFAAVERPADRFATSAAMVRHLLTDPVLPADRPAPALRTTYTDQRSELTEAGADRPREHRDATRRLRSMREAQKGNHGGS